MQKYPTGTLLKPAFTPIGFALSKTPTSNLGDAGSSIEMESDAIVEVIDQQGQDYSIVWWPAKNAYIRYISWEWFKPVKPDV